MKSGAVSVIMDGMMSMLLLSVDSLGSRKDQLLIDKIVMVTSKRNKNCFC